MHINHDKFRQKVTNMWLRKDWQKIFKTKQKNGKPDEAIIRPTKINSLWGEYVRLKLLIDTHNNSTNSNIIRFMSGTEDIRIYGNYIGL